MNYQIMGETVPAIEFTLNKGESIYTQSGSMSWKTPNIKMETNTRGGLAKGLGRMLAGESLFMNTYTSEADNEKIAFSSRVPGSVLPIDLTNSPGIIIQKGAFLCAENSIDCQITLTKRFSAGLFGGEGFILEKLSGNGTTFLEIDGDKKELELAAGQVIQVDTGNVVAFETTISYEVETVKGLGNIFFGGEGLFLTRLTGPGKVVLQTLNFNDFAGRIISLIPGR